MKLKNSAVSISLLLLTLIAAGCTHPLDVQGQGDIYSLNTDRQCEMEEAPCNLSISGAYTDVYQAVPRPGWEFSSWSGCPAAADNECSFVVSAAIVQANWGTTQSPLVANFVPMSTIQGDPNLPASSLGAWTPTFVDNFDGNGLNKSSWVPNRSTLPRRLSYYDIDALKVRNGNLDIIVLNRGESDRPYTAGAVSTQGLFKQKYGYFEMRAKIPKGNGYWPAFWLFPESGTWTSEIDIAEFLGHQTTSTHHAFHYGNRLRNENTATPSAGRDLSESYNNFAVHWTPNKIDYLVNGNVVHSVTGAALVGNASDEMFMIINLALSSQHTSFIPNVDANTNLNQAFSIDYVRVFKESANGPYPMLPGAQETIASMNPGAYDDTALGLNRIQTAQKDMFRSPGKVSGALELTSHKSNYDGTLTIFLTELINFNPADGRYSKGATIEAKNFAVNIADFNGKQQVNYQFDHLLTETGAFAVDIVIRDNVTGARKSHELHRVVQYLDASQPDTTVFFDAFFRAGSASYSNSRVNGTVQLQLQQALLTPYLDASYELVDINTGEVLGTSTERITHRSVGLTTLSPSIAFSAANATRSVGLITEITDSSGNFSAGRFASHVSGTANPPLGWIPSQLLNGGGSTTGQTIPELRWRSTMVDNFDYNFLNPNKWAPGGSMLHRRISYYDQDGVSSANGRLKIQALNRPESDRPYTTAAISTQGIFKQRYGYFEMRAKTPNGDGFWPAFWLFPESGQWTSEIDIAEFLGQSPDVVHYAMHYGNRLRNENSKTTPVGSDLTSGFNNYAVYWTPERIDFLFNGLITHSIDSAEAVNNADDEMFIILNLALASHLSGFITAVDANTDFNQALEVEYVRVYQEDPNGEHLGIPGPFETVPDTANSSYGDTALSVNQVNPAANVNFMRQPGRISGALNLKAHKPNQNAIVGVSLVRLENFNESNGSWGNVVGVEAKNYQVNLSSVADTQQISYNFDTLISSPGVYGIDVVVNDTTTGNKKRLALTRVVQYVSSSQPNTTVFFDGFLRGGTATANGQQVFLNLDLQLQQAMLAAHINVDWSIVRRATGQIIASKTKQVQQTFVGQMTITDQLSANLSNGPFDVKVRVTDSSGRFLIVDQTAPVN